MCLAFAYSLGNLKLLDRRGMPLAKTRHVLAFFQGHDVSTPGHAGWSDQSSSSATDITGSASSFIGT